MIKKIKKIKLIKKFFLKKKKKRKKKTKIKKSLYLFWLFPISMVTVFYVLILKGLPSPTQLGNYEIPLSTRVYDRNQKLLYNIFTEQNRTPVPLADIPETVRHATIAIEDKNFYQHQGINPIGGILRAMYSTVTKRRLEGGSTITQQLVKSALLTPERSIIRKTKEMILAYWVEAIYSKDKILELYLNQVPYGGTAWGIQTAAEKYFNKNVSDLNLAEAALLAGLPQAPTSYSPFGAHPERAEGRQHEVLRRMVEDNFITQKEADGAKNTELVYKKQEDIKAPHFVMYVKEQLVEKYGHDIVEKGGLQVTTTLDLDLQEFAQATVAGEVTKLNKYNVTNGAVLITKPATGEILAMVGSVDYFATPSGSYNVTTALRQPGSSIKPINYAIGLEKKIVTPASIFLDVPTCFSSAGQPLYCPRNYDGKFRGPVQLRFTLGNSLNIPAVKMLYLNTVTDMVASASAFGLNTLKDPKNYGLSLTLGGGEVRMVDMATAFSVFPNAGIRKDLVSILEVKDKNNQVLYEYSDPNLTQEIPSQLLLKGERVISPETAFLISHILLDNNARTEAFGSSSSLVIPGHTVSVKTGTTDDLRDNWTIGFTPQYLITTWVGNNDNSPMNPWLVSGVTGAAPIWNKLMREVLKDKLDIWPKQPDGIVGAQVCSLTGSSPLSEDESGEKCSIRYEYFIKGTVPQNQQPLKQHVIIDKDTGDIAQKGKIENTEIQEKTVISDSISSWCIDCTHDKSKPVIIR